MKKTYLAILIIAVAVSGLALLNGTTARSADLASVELSVSRMTCGSCVETIRQAVLSLDGPAEIVTDVRSARSYVTYDPQRVAPDKIATTITGSGYPATILFVRDASGNLLSGVDLDKVVGRVGSRMIERGAFNKSFERTMQAVEEQGRPVPLGVVFQSAWSSLVQNELLLNAAIQNGLTVDEAEIDSGMTDAVTREEVRNRLLIKRFLQTQFPDREPNGIALSNLLKGLQANTAIDIFDPNLKRNLSSRNGNSGCGGSCCG